ncbi:UNVERIFIED_ORG: hypothetical protein BDK47_103125 [Anoxybacillus amylolyticus]
MGESKTSPILRIKNTAPEGVRDGACRACAYARETYVPSAVLMMSVSPSLTKNGT